MAKRKHLGTELFQNGTLYINDFFFRSMKNIQKKKLSNEKMSTTKMCQSVTHVRTLAVGRCPLLKRDIP